MQKAPRASAAPSASSHRSGDPLGSDGISRYRSSFRCSRPYKGEKHGRRVGSRAAGDDDPDRLAFHGASDRILHLYSARSRVADIVRREAHNRPRPATRTVRRHTLGRCALGLAVVSAYSLALWMPQSRMITSSNSTSAYDMEKAGARAGLCTYDTIEASVRRVILRWRELKRGLCGRGTYRLRHAPTPRKPTNLHISSRAHGWTAPSTPSPTFARDECRHLRSLAGAS